MNLMLIFLLAPLVVLPLVATFLLYTHGGVRIVLLGYAVGGALVSLAAGILGLAISPKIMRDFSACCLLGVGIFSLIFIAREIGPSRPASKMVAARLPAHETEPEKNA